MVRLLGLPIQASREGTCFVAYRKYNWTYTIGPDLAPGPPSLPSCVNALWMGMPSRVPLKSVDKEAAMIRTPHVLPGMAGEAGERLSALVLG